MNIEFFKQDKAQKVELNDGGSVYLTIVIGDAQNGGSSITVDGVVMPNPEPVTSFPLGIGSTLKGKTLAITTNIEDRKKTKLTSVTVHIDQSNEPRQTYSFPFTLSAVGNRVIYSLMFFFPF